MQLQIVETLVLVAVMASMVFYLWWTGRALRASRTSDGGYDPLRLAHHRGVLACVGCLTVLLILLIESQVQAVRSFSDPYEAGGLVLISHWFVDVFLLVVALAVVFRFTGLYSATLHKILVYPAIGLFLASAATGVFLLLYRLPAQ